MTISQELENLEQQLHEITELYERVSADRQLYIKLWCKVPVEQRMAIHEHINEHGFNICKKCYKLMEESF